jgi:predicted RNase H-like HicB family nuclease
MSAGGITVFATWDEEAKVWWARSDDIEGLATEAETIEKLIKKLEVIIPELVGLNDGEGTGQCPLPVHLMADKRLELDMRTSQ